jgi:hypothetical protein
MNVRESYTANKMKTFTKKDFYKWWIIHKKIYSEKIIPTSENHFENKLWLFISINCPYLNLSDSLITSFCAKALHNDVLPVPGGPTKNK